MKFPRDTKILVERLLHEEVLKGKQEQEIINFWDDNGAYIFGFCQDVELVTEFPQYSLFSEQSGDNLLKDIPEEKIYTRLAAAIHASMNDETIYIQRI
jgi:hypothetical protein